MGDFLHFFSVLSIETLIIRTYLMNDPIVSDTVYSSFSVPNKPTNQTVVFYGHLIDTLCSREGRAKTHTHIPTNTPTYRVKQTHKLSYWEKTY